MKSTRVAVLLVALNLALLGGVLYLIRAIGAKPAQPQVIVKQAPPVVVKEPEIVTVVKTNDFKWAQLESEDYRTYIQRLRAIGCPEETIRDIIISDVEKLMAPRIKALALPKKDLTYWESEEKELEDPRAYHEAALQQLEVDFEKRDIVQELVGVDLVAERMKAQGQEDYFGQRLAFLPEDKRIEMRKLLERYNRTEAAMREKVWAEGETLTPEDEAQIRQIQQRRETEIAALLTPEEWRQYELWLSPTSYKVRDSLFGMNVSEGEFLAVFQAQKEFDSQWAWTDLSDDSVREAYEAATGKFQAGLRQTLGETRYRDYERAQDPDFRQLSIAAARNQVPRKKAEEVYEVKRISLLSRQSVVEDAALTEEQKETVLREMTLETDRTVRGLLGEKAYNYYVRHSEATWLK
ncbi:MAG: hypothetical protein AB1705_08830 [Verrucomicrobiota bacterium]